MLVGGYVLDILNILVSHRNPISHEPAFFFNMAFVADSVLEISTSKKPRLEKRSPPPTPHFEDLRPLHLRPSEATFASVTPTVFSHSPPRNFSRSTLDLHSPPNGAQEPKSVLRPSISRSQSSTPPSPIAPHSITFTTKTDAAAVARKTYIKAVARGAIIATLMIFGLFPIYWGALWKSNEHVKNLKGWVVVRIPMLVLTYISRVLGFRRRKSNRRVAH